MTRFTVKRALPAVALSVAAALAGLPSWSDEPQPEVDPKDLPRIPPVSPQEALKTFRLRKGFRLEQVAAEPLVVDPIALSFDEDGRLFVVEMRDYPDDREKRKGRIRRLEDTDGDGRFDKSVVYAQDLPLPSGVFTYGGGIFVASAPDIIYFKDTNGDGVADVRRVVFTGFGSKASTTMPEAVFNSFRWGLDNRIHGATSMQAGVITKPGDPTFKALEVRGDFSFDPRALIMTTEAGGGQYGMSFDDVGRKFVCNNRSHIRTMLFDKRYADRNPYYAMPNPLVEIAVDGPAAALYRISPEEPWRILRTKWRVTNLSDGPGGIEGGGKASGYFTASSGITVYRGDAWPREFVGDAFVGEPAENIVHRKKVVHTGPFARAERPADEQKVEFLASRDIWFRPVELANAPDGNLYVADMYREVIQQSVSIPESILKYLDPASGIVRGRIYRIVPEAWKGGRRVRLGQASSAELVATLEHANGWHRDTAARLLYERNDRSIAPQLEALAAGSQSPLGRMHALHALAGLGALEERQVVRALGDADAAVREHAVRLSEGFLLDRVPSAPLWQKLRALAADPAAGVRYQLAFTLGEVKHPQRVAALAEVARRGAGEPTMRSAILSSLAEGGGELFGLLAKDTGGARAAGPGLGELLRDVAAVLGAANQPADLSRVQKALASARDPSLALGLARGLGDGLRRAGTTLAKAGVKVDSLIKRARAVAVDGRAPEPVRVEAIALLGLSPGGDTTRTLFGLLEPREARAIQLGALAALDKLSPAGLSEHLLQALPSLTPAVREQVIAVMIKRPERIEALLAALEAGTLQRRDLSPIQLAAMRRQSNPALRERINKVAGALTDRREEVVKRFLPAIRLHGQAVRGKTVFLQRCQSCHRLGSEGFAVGPDLVTARNAGRETLLVSILDPNREVTPNFFAYVVETKEKESLIGIVVNETAGNVTVRQSFGNESIVPRSKIAKMEVQRASLMPEGLEEGLSQQDLADLLEFIFSST